MIGQVVLNVFVLYICWSQINFSIYSIEVCSLLLCNIFFALNMLFIRNGGYSLFKIYYIFNFLFMGIAPMIQLSHSSVIWSNNFIDQSDYILPLAYVLFSQLLYYIVYLVVYNRVCVQGKRMYLKKIRKQNIYILLIFSFICFIWVLRYFQFQITHVFFRGIEGEVREFNQLDFLFTMYFIRPIPLLVFLCLLSYKEKIKNNYLFVFLILGVLTLFPTSVARFQAAAMYIPICLFFSDYLRRGNNFVYFIIGGLLFVFPFLDIFRRFSSDTNISINLNLEMFTEGHFDAFQNFLFVVKYNLVTYGNQFLGSLLFFIPRTIWSSKPTGSGAFVAESFNFSFSNISMPFLAEGYINGCFLGILIFISFLAGVNAYLDKRFLSSSDSLFNVIYLLSLGMMFFILRGDLLSGTAYACGLYAGLYLVNKVINLRALKVR